MYRSPLRAAFANTVIAAPKAPAARRFITTAPPHKLSRSWKNAALRWTLAGGLVYYYNASSVFAEEPAFYAPSEISQGTESYPTLEAIAEQRRAQVKAQAQTQPITPTSTETTATAPDAEEVLPGSPEGLEEEAGQEGAFNEETGEINWGCPCLGGMATGPCGEQFKAAFSCFVYSKEEPKGVECIDHFKTMQNCFREHPEVYGSELEDDEAPLEMPDGQDAPIDTHSAPVLASEQTPSQSTSSEAGINREGRRERAQAATEQVRQDHGVQSETERAIPKAAHDAN